MDIGSELVLATGTIDDRGHDVLDDETRTFEQDLVVMAGRVEPGERHDAAELRADPASLTPGCAWLPPRVG